MMNDLLTSQYVAYELAGEKYALKISDVYEIIKMQSITPIHNSKPFLEGLSTCGAKSFLWPIFIKDSVLAITLLPKKPALLW